MARVPDVRIPDVSLSNLLSGDLVNAKSDHINQLLYYSVGKDGKIPFQTHKHIGEFFRYINAMSRVVQNSQIFWKAHWTSLSENAELMKKA